MTPQLPSRIDPFAQACLAALRQCPAAAKISLGGAFALAAYHEFRNTHDIDAWWEADCTAAEQAEVIQVVRDALAGFGQVQQRQHGDVVSIELTREGKTVFSFQVARRSALLTETIASPWPPIRMDSLEDLLAAKMGALIVRGAPRDFVDIREMCRVALTRPDECWRLWQQREEARGGSSSDRPSAMEAVLLHLSRIERSRPLESISDSSDRARASELRRWFKDEFCKAK